ncbi:hypothetical protein CCUS01_03583 [Colletotrichum cuscutae]|uniref:Xylanolytic transcriptional activator regulatory domain-containing protein n=1 Tax=Colletotrichum cuscutae TaxID=1209917 RepID=A0AAI9VH59_9PEZI|nr:hypothetical protein CCUS01_03583 [Colletotrichum cuscutae]
MRKMRPRGSRMLTRWLSARGDIHPAISTTPTASFAAPESVAETPRVREEPLHRSLQNPSDALLILARAAEDEEGDGPPLDNPADSTPGNASSALGSILSPVQQTRQDPLLPFGSPVNPATIERDIGEYPPVKNGALDAPLLHHLLQHYATNYHPYFPIVPSNVLLPQYLHETINHESFLLTAALVVASRDRSDLAELHQSIWAHMRHLILDVVLGMSTIRSVGCVEGLLLLGEWTPLTLGQNDDGGEGAAWSIVGLGVRLAYLLRFEESSFRADKEADPAMLRRRLAWTFTYLSDRQISIRMGQAFWSRGPALSARFTAEDFPSLQPQYASGDDFASLLQAQVELTTLFGNAHDILFASKQRTAELMVRGDYTKYIDDATRFYLYEIHAAVFLYKAHAAGAISSGKHAQTASLMRRFVGVLETAATDTDHIASKYAKLLNGLWFHKGGARGDATRSRGSEERVQSDEVDDVNAFNRVDDYDENDDDTSHLPSFDEIGLQPLDWIESVEGLFSMPAPFPWDQSIY